MHDETSYIAIGDIHGCLNTLKALLDSIPLSKNDHLVFLGDYVDRGPYSKEVIDFLIELHGTHTCTFLMGNHELLMLDYLDFNVSEPWASNGGEATLKSYSNSGLHRIPSEHVDFLKQCPIYLETENYFFVHGGISPYKSISENINSKPAKDFVWERSHLHHSTLSISHEKWEKTVVCGHTPQPEPLLMPKLICIDTGCVYIHRKGFGKLTAISLPSRHLIQKENLDFPKQTLF